MPDIADKINELSAKQEALISRQKISTWKNELKLEISRLKTNAVARPSGEKTV